MSRPELVQVPESHLTGQLAPLGSSSRDKAPLFVCCRLLLINDLIFQEKEKSGKSERCGTVYLSDSTCNLIITRSVEPSFRREAMFTLLVEMIIARCGYRVKWCACLAYLMQPKRAGFLVADVMDDGGRRRCSLGVSLSAGLEPPRRILRECERTTYKIKSKKMRTRSS